MSDFGYSMSFMSDFGYSMFSMQGASLCLVCNFQWHTIFSGLHRLSLLDTLQPLPLHEVFVVPLDIA